MNQELFNVFVADQMERNDHSDNDTPNTYSCECAMHSDGGVSEK